MQLLRDGVRVTVNSDDPAYFGAYITDDYLALARAAGLSAAEVVLLARNAFTIAWLSTTRRDQYLAELDAYAGPTSRDVRPDRHTNRPGMIARNDRPSQVVED